MSDDIWHSLRIEQETDARAYRDRRERWVQRILSDPVVDLQAIKVSAASLDRLAHEISTQQVVSDWYEVEHLAMDFLIAAIHAGACSGIEWLEWRTRLAGKPHIHNAVEFLFKYAPPRHAYPPPTGAKSLYGQTASEIRTIVMVIRQIVAEIERAPKPPERATLAPPEAVEEDHIAEILQALLELKAFDLKTRKPTPAIARRVIGPDADPARLKRYISVLKKRGDVGTKSGRTGGAWLTEQGRTAAMKNKQ